MSYLFEHSWKHEGERLAAIEGSLDAYSIACLTAIGVAPGWHCLEVGAGAGSIAQWLCERVAARGSVVATDLETSFLEKLEAINLEVRRHDITSDPLEEEAFDLVHARKVLEHLPKPEQALEQMHRATKPGGWILVEDADLVSLLHACASDLGLVQRAYGAFVRCMEAHGYHADLGLHLGDALRRLGLRQVQVRGWVGEWTGAGPNPSVYLRTFEKIQEKVIARGELSAADSNRFLEEIQSPDFRGITAIHFAAWGQRPI
ncbi:MAG TPA: methyltransferase domain-containing protein [Myxococcota bacterium]|nr:methyltransferase domain-containing protein [Myxococcota bacterium]